MKLTLEILAGLSGAELLLWLAPLWRLRKPLSCVLLVVLSIMMGALLAEHLSAWVILVGILSLYRVINLLRLAEGRIQADYLYHASRKTAFCLIGLQMGVIAAAGVSQHFQPAVLSWFYLLS
jgi:hypothetical protein